MEADLQRFYGLDYRDRWRDGTGRLTLRRLAVLIEHLPADSALAAEAKVQDWSLTNVLIAQLWQLWAGKPHPMLQSTVKQLGRAGVAPERLRAVQDFRRRARERELAIERGEIQ